MTASAVSKASLGSKIRKASSTACSLVWAA
jgi:hypothetical protein